MRILGVDPGLASVGYGLIVYPEGGPDQVHWGEIKTSPSQSTPERLRVIFESLRAVIRELKPEAVSVEELFFAANMKTAIQVAQARGAALLATAESGVQVAEYTPLQIKKAITGQGRASKSQVQKMVSVLLGLREIPRPDHASDALAAALCHGHTIKADRMMRLAR